LADLPLTAVSIVAGPAVTMVLSGRRAGAAARASHATATSVHGWFADAWVDSAAVFTGSDMSPGTRPTGGREA
jgi:hypothetical protein